MVCEWQSPIEPLTRSGHCKQSLCLLKPTDHFPLHLSAIRCNYLNQQGDLQRVTSIPRCRSRWDHFQHIIFSPRCLFSFDQNSLHFIFFCSVLCLFRLSPHGWCACCLAFVCFTRKFLYSYSPEHNWCPASWCPSGIFSYDLTQQHKHFWFVSFCAY